MLPHLLLFLLPLLWRVALRRPGVDGRDLGLERRVDEPVAREERFGRELGRHDYRIEGLAAAACACGQKKRLANKIA